MNEKQKNQTSNLAIHLIIFLAGFTFLIYEVCWNRMLSLVLGTTVTASTIVLASLMAGFGAGAFFWGRIANRAIKTGKLLAVLLAGIGIFSALNFFLISRTIPYLYSSFASAGIATTLTEIIVFSISIIILFIPAFLMGGVLPVISKITVRSNSTIASSLGSLYASDTLGSTIGGLAAGFIFLGFLGQQNTVILAVVINLIIGFGILLSGKFNQASVHQSSDSKPKSKSHSKVFTRDVLAQRKTALVGAFICGFSILSLQIFWIRMFRIYFTNTSYTFALVASLSILGLAVGSYLFKRRSARIKNMQKSMLTALILLGITSAVGLVLLIYFPHIFMFPFQSSLENPIMRVFVLPCVASILIIFPPALFSGYAFPLACSMYSSGQKNISKDVGYVLMVNTVGSVLGPVLAAFVLLPLLGATLSVILIVAFLFGAALYIIRKISQSFSLKIIKNILFGAVLILLIVVIVRPDIRILPPSFSRFDREVLFYRESVEGTLSVAKDRGTRTDTKYTFVNNSAVIGSTYDAVKVVKMVGHFPFFLNLDCKDVLVIGFGIGVTTSAIAAHPEVESIECVELVAGLKDAAVYYKDLNFNVVSDPRLKIIAGDGRHYLQLTAKKYDLISCDPTHPILGSGNLYTKEYFAMCREHLNPGGMVSQYLPLHKLRTEELMGIISTFYSEFPHSTVWLGHYHAVLLGSTEPIQIDFEDWFANVLRTESDDYFYIDPYHLAATLVLDSKTIAKLSADRKINSDNHSYTEFFAPACLDDDNISKNLQFLMDNRSDVNSVFLNVFDFEKMARYVRGNHLLTKSLFHKWSGEDQLSIEALQRAAIANPEDQEFPFLLKFNYPK